MKNCWSRREGAESKDEEEVEEEWMKWDGSMDSCVSPFRSSWRCFLDLCGLSSAIGLLERAVRLWLTISSSDASDSASSSASCSFLSSSSSSDCG